MKKISLDKTNKIRLVGAIVFLLVSIAVTLLMIPLIMNLRTDEGRMLIKQKVEDFGVFAPILYMLLHILHVVIAFIPGEPIEILGGVLFGTLWGLLFSVIGVLAGTIIVYFLVKTVGKPLIYAFVPEDKFNKYKLLNDEKRLELAVFVLFLIPGTPKDILTYIVPLTHINPTKYFILTSVARIPSIITSTLMGASIGDGDIRMTVIIFLITGAIGVVGILLNNRSNKKNSKK